MSARACWAPVSTTATPAAVAIRAAEGARAKIALYVGLAALALWLYLIHVLVLVGYRLTLVLDARWRPAGS